MNATPPSRRAVLSGALGLSALGAMGGAALASGSAAALGDVTVPATPSGDYYMRLSGVTGSSKMKGYEGQIPTLTWGWGVSSPVDPLGSGTGRPLPEDLIFLANTDIHSPGLIRAVNGGTGMAQATLTCVKGGSTPFAYLTILLSGPLVTDYYLTPNATDGTPVDVVHLKFRKIAVTFTPQLASGGAGTPVRTSWDYVNGTP